MRGLEILPPAHTHTHANGFVRNATNVHRSCRRWEKADGLCECDEMRVVSVDAGLRYASGWVCLTDKQNTTKKLWS